VSWHGTRTWVAAELVDAATGNEQWRDNIDYLYSTLLTPRVGGTASSATPTPNVDAQDIYALTALAAGATFGAPTGTPANGQPLILRIKDNGTARTLAWNAAYTPGGVALPTTTVLGKIMHLGFRYNTDNGLNKWMLLAAAQEA